ncbi:MAG TPA: RelA/SpoT family protein, partial [Arenicellales bacterium]|nr:RelA/SpoT family protein [Arenicellales bacterium]
MPIRPLRRSRASSRALFGIGFRPERRVLISELISQLEVYLDNDAVSEVYRAYVFAAEAHEGQTRISGEPYIYHPLAVAQLLAEKQLDTKSISAAILHDIIEDTPTAKEQIATEFGEDIALLVDGVSKITQIEFDSKEHAEAENIRKMLLAMSQDIRVILIKLADRLHNMRTLESLPVEKQKRIARQTLEIFAAIANRLGVYSWSRELEEISFQTIYPKRYDALAKALRRRESHRRSGMKKLLAVMETHLKEGDVNAQVVSREKDIFSIYRKMQRKRMSFEEIQDIYGFRIIVNNSDDCYRVLGRIHGLYKPIPGRFKDYIAIPKANGYQSLHTTVFGAFGESLEVQIRTEEMNRIAEAGIAAHWVYKSDDITGKQSQAQARQWLLDLLDTQKQVANPSEFLEHLKVDLFPDKIYVFTPKGDIKKFPQGATALDFAYAIHSDVGNRCVGARFNQQLVPLHTRLRNGDHVEVTTSRSALPTPSWLSYATTSKARTAIRGNLKTQRRKDSVRLGRKLLDRAVKTLGTTSRRVSPTRRQQLLQTLHLEEWD